MRSFRLDFLGLPGARLPGGFALPAHWGLTIAARGGPEYASTAVVWVTGIAGVVPRTDIGGRRRMWLDVDTHGDADDGGKLLLSFPYLPPDDPSRDAEWITEIENKLVEHPKVLEAAIVGREDDEQLVKPEAFIVLNNPQDAGKVLETELLEHCKSGLARYKYPRWFNFVDDLPKTATGKIQRFQLRSD